ncbi:uncharacterized protein LOC115311108 [Ixodes scapularis]|uniref:uncharacterized protein LOC115311108 n=1 Tax=Ixodes scapularis TaxID=6945 RepID=UPI001C3853DA|nr:uncharacterized protein LOC115311108 [Ixodes scapularis]
MCVTTKILSLGFNGYQFYNIYPLVAEVFGRSGQNLTAMDFLASYCDDASHASDAFCQVDPSIDDATCGTPIVFDVPVPEGNDAQCEQSDACQSVLPTDPKFSRFIANEFVCVANLQSASVSGEIYNDVACFLGYLLSILDLTQFTVEEQLNTVKLQLLASGTCTLRQRPASRARARNAARSLCGTFPVSCT